MLMRVVDLLLYGVGLAHFLVLVASVQVPSRLGWYDDLAKLTPFNRKLMWVYGGFTVGTIAAFGVLTLVLHDELARGDRAAVAVAWFIGIYWTARIAVDALVFDHDEWPRGRLMTLGHIALVSLFATLAVTYLGLAAWRTWW